MKIHSIALAVFIPATPWLSSDAFAAAPPADVVEFAGLGATEAAARATLPPGFKMRAFAAEPDVRQPIAFCLDDRGRVWVAEGITYPRRKGNPPKTDAPAETPTAEQLKDIFAGGDRILVLEDTDGDHKFDKRTVFLENVNLISGLEVGFGGVWIGAAPYLLHVPVKDWDNPKPAGDPKILLDGWNYSADTHETLNTFTWGPDGWLYGCHGVFCPSNPGKPGTPARERQWVDAGVWRYHPTRHVMEMFTEGGSNPWGIDFDEHGQLFAEMCVIPHFWHMMQGARIERQGGEHFTVGAEETARYRKSDGKPVHPHIYEDIKQHGDHVHWAGGGGPHAGNARSDAAGGGHAHAGVMCYLGESWPAEYRGKIIMGNIHGQRLNMDIPMREGSGYVGKHGKDFLNFNDKWSQTLNQLYDQDGSVFIIDWYDKNQCHHNREDGHDRSNGRIYKIVFKDQKTTRVDVAKLSNEELVKLVPSKNEFMSRHARRVLQERVTELAKNETVEDMPAAFGELMKRHQASQKIGALETLRMLVDESKDTSARLRALWALHAATAMKLEDIARWAQDKDEQVRGWMLQLYYERADLLFSGRESVAELAENSLDALARAAANENSPVVRRFIASAAQRVPVAKRAPIVNALLKRGEDAGDHNLPLMYWFAAEPLAADQPAGALDAALDSKLPKILNFTTRRVAATGTSQARDLITAKLASLDDAAKQLEMLTGLSAALKGQRSVPMPSGWDAVESKLGASANAAVRTLAQSLSVTFGSQRALVALRKTLADKSVPGAARRSALDSLLGVKDAELPGALLKLLGDGEVRGPAVRALANYSDAGIPAAVLAAYPSLDATQKRDALNTLVSRPASAKALLTAVAANKVSSKDLTAEIIRQLRGMKDADVQRLLTTAYGTIRETPADKKAEMEKYRKIYAAGYSQPGDSGRGRVLYNKVCAQCHTLFDVGGKVGPDITGANRKDLDYLLETIVDPNAVIPNEYRTSEIETKDGRSLTGIVKVMGDKSVQFQTANELLTIPRDEIASQRQTELSMMPEGLLAPLSDQEVRDLIYYLTRPGQVPLPAGSAEK